MDQARGRCNNELKVDRYTETTNVHVRECNFLVHFDLNESVRKLFFIIILVFCYNLFVLYLSFRNKGEERVHSAAVGGF